MTRLLCRLASAFLAALVLPAVVVGAVAANRIYHPPRRRRTGGGPIRGMHIRTTLVRATRDDLQLAAWVVPGRGPDTVIVSHGIGLSKSAVRGHVKMLRDAGHNVVAYDLRNHGESGRDRAHGRMAERFVSDLGDVVRFVRDDPELGRGAIGLLAFSFSVWPAMAVVGDPALPVCALVCDSGPATEISTLFRRFYDVTRASMHPVLREQPLYGMSRLAFRLVGGRMLGVRTWPPDLRTGPTVVLFIGGGADTIVPPEDSVSYWRRFRQSIWLCAGAPHMMAFRVERDEYVRRVTTFFHDAFEAARLRPQAVGGG